MGPTPDPGPGPAIRVTVRTSHGSRAGTVSAVARAVVGTRTLVVAMEAARADEARERAYNKLVQWLDYELDWTWHEAGGDDDGAK